MTLNKWMGFFFIQSIKWRHKPWLETTACTKLLNYSEVCVGNQVLSSYLPSLKCLRQNKVYIFINVYTNTNCITVVKHWNWLYSYITVEENVTLYQQNNVLFQHVFIRHLELTWKRREYSELVLKKKKRYFKHGFCLSKIVAFH